MSTTTATNPSNGITNLTSNNNIQNNSNDNGGGSTAAEHGALLLHLTRSTSSTPLPSKESTPTAANVEEEDHTGTLSAPRCSKKSRFLNRFRAESMHVPVTVFHASAMSRTSAKGVVRRERSQSDGFLSLVAASKHLDDRYDNAHLLLEACAASSNSNDSEKGNEEEVEMRVMPQSQKYSLHYKHKNSNSDVVMHSEVVSESDEGNSNHDSASSSAAEESSGGLSATSSSPCDVKMSDRRCDDRHHNRNDSSSSSGSGYHHRRHPNNHNSLSSSSSNNNVHGNTKNSNNNHNSISNNGGAEKKEGWVGAYSPESRKLRIERFLKSRQKRVWTKKVKYDVRKNFADSRLRVKGRFVKKEDEMLMRDLMSIT